MDLRNLRTFQAIVDFGSYQNAAVHLGYTQSTVTLQIKQLEEELGIPLFEKKGRKMVLTQIGEQALLQARELLLSADRLSAIGSTEQALTGTLRVDIAETLLCYRIQPLLMEFRKQAPDVHLILRNRSCMQIADNLKAGSCDLGVSFAVDWHKDLLDVDILDYNAKLLLVAAPDFANKDFITPHQVKPVSVIIDEPDSLFRRQLERYLRQKDIVMDETIELWSTESIKRCVMANLGITFLPSFAVEEELSSGKLIILDAPISGIKNPVLCVHHKTRYVTPAMELFMKLLHEKCFTGF